MQRLEVFGSAASGQFDPATSDIDFLVTFENVPQARSFSIFFDLKDDLQTLLKREVDLVEKEAIRNPHFLQRVQQSTRKLIYESRTTEIVA